MKRQEDICRLYVPMKRLLAVGIVQGSSHDHRDPGSPFRISSMYGETSPAITPRARGNLSLPDDLILLHSPVGTGGSRRVKRTGQERLPKCNGFSRPPCRVDTRDEVVKGEAGTVRH